MDTKLELIGFTPGGDRDADGLPEWVDLVYRASVADARVAMAPTVITVRMDRETVLRQAQDDDLGDWTQTVSFAASAECELCDLFTGLLEDCKYADANQQVLVEADGFAPRAPGVPEGGALAWWRRRSAMSSPPA